MSSLKRKIFADMRKHILYDKQRIDGRQLEELAEEARRRRRADILSTLKSVKDRVPLIAEFKPASPEKIYFFHRNPLKVVSEMLEGGACAISVLTEPIYYRGSLHYLYRISDTYNVPLLRKDLILEEFQVYEAAAAGASSYLLIVEQFKDPRRLEDMIQLGRSLGLEPLVEVNDARDVGMVNRTSAKLVGVNNGEGEGRNLERTRILSESLNVEFLVSESGIRSVEDVKFVMNYANGILVGTALSEAVDVKAKVRSLCMI
ncbi:MAG: indole-3-glycerol-phosphate synthase [Thermoproteota archaeon]